MRKHRYVKNEQHRDEILRTKRLSSYEHFRHRVKFTDEERRAWNNRRHYAGFALLLTVFGLAALWFVVLFVLVLLFGVKL